MITALAARLRLGLGGDATLGTVLELLAAVHGRRRLIEEPSGEVVSYRDAAGRVDRWAGALAARIEPGDRVVLATPNGYDQFLLCLAVSRAGGIAVPVNPQMRPDEVDHVVADAGADVVVRAASRARGCRGAGSGRPGGARRRRGALLHVGYDGPAQGRRAHPPRPPRGPHARRPRRSRAAAARRGGRGPPGRPHHGVRRPPRPGLQRCARLRAGALPARRRARRPGAAARHDLRGRAGHVPPPPGGRRGGTGPVECAGVGLGGRRHARRPRRPVPASRRHRQAALRRARRQGHLLRGLRPGRVVGRGGRQGQPAPARPAAAG